MPTHQIGGYLKDYQHLPRQFPDNVGRTVKACITKYFGIGKHFFVSLSAGPNFFINPETGDTFNPWDDPGDKQFDQAKFNTILGAKRWLNRTLKSPEWTGFILEWEAHSLPWNYKDGD